LAYWMSLGSENEADGDSLWPIDQAHHVALVEANRQATTIEFRYGISRNAFRILDEWLELPYVSYV
jgi:hypothetical protein